MTALNILEPHYSALPMRTKGPNVGNYKFWVLRKVFGISKL